MAGDGMRDDHGGGGATGGAGAQGMAAIPHATGRGPRTAMRYAAVMWAAALPLAARVASSPDASAAYPFALIVYAVGALVCHQRPERSFHTGGAVWPVCARCTGVYLGAACAAVVGAWAGWMRLRAPHGGWRTRVPRLGVRAAVCLAALPTAATLGYEWLGGGMPGNVVRLAAGVPLGLLLIYLG